MITIKTNYINGNQVGWLEQELLKEEVPILKFIVDPADFLVEILIDDSATVDQLNWAQDLADNMQSLTLTMLNQADEPSDRLFADGEDYLKVSCTELPTDFEYEIQYGSEVVDSGSVDDGTLEIHVNVPAKYSVHVFEAGNLTVRTVRRFWAIKTS